MGLLRRIHLSHQRFLNAGGQFEDGQEERLPSNAVPHDLDQREDAAFVEADRAGRHMRQISQEAENGGKQVAEMNAKDPLERVISLQAQAVARLDEEIRYGDWCDGSEGGRGEITQLPTGSPKLRQRD